MSEFRDGKPWWQTITDDFVDKVIIDRSKQKAIQEEFNLPDDPFGAQEMVDEESPLSILAGEVKKKMAKARGVVNKGMLDKYTSGMDFEEDAPKKGRTSKAPKKADGPLKQKVPAPEKPLAEAPKPVENVEKPAQSAKKSPETPKKITKIKPEPRASELRKTAELMKAAEVSPKMPPVEDKSLLQRLSKSVGGKKTALAGAALLGAGVLYNLMTRDIEPLTPNLPDPEPVDIPNATGDKNFYQMMLEQGAGGIDEVIGELKRRQR